MDIVSIDIGDSVAGFRTVKTELPFIKLNWISSIGYLYNFLLLIGTIIVLCIVVFECREYVKALLMWVESQEQWLVYVIFAFLFTLVSFPFTWGYTFLVIASGYIFGILRGFLTVLLTVNFGVFVAHFSIRIINSKFPFTKYLQTEKIQAILSVISGPKAFKVAVFSRLTPIPFGLQNLIFAVSNINVKIYFIASFFGLIPAQIINVYLGSSLRSMEEVLSHKSTATTGIIVFFQITVGVCLMLYVLSKARQELRKTLYNSSFVVEVS